MAQKRKRNKKWISWLLLLLLLIGAAVVVFLVWDNYFRDKKEDAQQTEQVEKTEKVEKVEESMEGEKDEAEKAVEQKKVEQYEGGDPNKAEELSGAVTYAGVVDDKLMIRINIDQYLNDGECGLTLKRGGATIYNSIARITGNASTATCEGFDVPVENLGGGGLEIIINLNANGKTGVIRGEVSL